MTSAERWADMTDKANRRMAIAPRATGATVPGDVWCAHCDQRATVEVRLTSGETRAYCARCIARLTIQTPLNQIAKTWSEL